MTEELNQRLKRLRLAKGLTAQAVAERIGVPGSTYRDWENGKGLKIPPLEKISHLLAVSVTELVTGRQNTKNDVIANITIIELHLRELKIAIGSLE